MIRTIDFNALPPGAIVTDSYRLTDGLRVSALGASDRAMILDSRTGVQPDPTLTSAGLGGMLILSADGQPDLPRDAQEGGSLFFDFDAGVRVKSLTFKDIEPVDGEATRMVFYDATGTVIEDHFVDPTGTGGERVVGLNVPGVARMEVRLAGGGAVDNLVFDDGDVVRPTLIAVDDTGSTPEDTPLVLDLRANDLMSGLSPETVEIVEVTSPDGMVEVLGDGRILFTPNENFNGATALSYRLSTGAELSAPATVSVDVLPVNDPPAAASDLAETVEGETLKSIPVLANDSDPDGDALRVIAAVADAGTVTVNADGTLSFTPEDGFTGLAEITYRLSDRPPGDPDALESDGLLRVLVTPATGSDGIVLGTAADDLIDLAYDQDPDGDVIDASDMRLPGYGPEDDIVVAGAGDDTVLAGQGDDLVDGGEGEDFLSGGEGDDSLWGGAGDDRLEGGAGADRMLGGTGADLFIGLNPGDLVDGGDSPLDIDVIDLRGSAPPGGRLKVTYTSDDREDGFVTFFDAEDTALDTRLTFSEIETVVPCFTPGTWIATPQGERRVDQLRVGDPVITRDNGIQPIRWVGTRQLSPAELHAAAHLGPILIRRGALGNGLPERDMRVSPNHRVLMVHDRAALYFEEREVLVAAKHLTGLPGVERAKAAGVTYVHMMFDHHQVILSDGSWTESFQPGDFTLKGIGAAQRAEIIELFPELAGAPGVESYRAARKALKKHEAHLLVS